MRRAATLAAVAAVAGATLVAALPPPAGPADAPLRDAGPDGLLVLAVLGPERAMVADPRTGETTARELPGGTLCHGPLVAAGRRVAYIALRHGRFTALAAPLGRPGRARSLGRADVIDGVIDSGSTVARPHEPRRGSQVSYLAPRGRRRRSRDRPRAPRDARTGRARGYPRRRPLDHARVADRAPPAATSATPDRRRPAARGRRLALRLVPAGCGRVRVWTEAGGRTLDPPAGLRPELAGQPAFSPDGKRLALPVTTPAGARVAVVDLEAGRWRIIPGATIDGYMAAAWSPSGRWLYFTGRGNRLLASRDGVVRPVRLPVRTGGTVMSIAVS